MSAPSAKRQRSESSKVIPRASRGSESYLRGFGNFLRSEAVDGALPALGHSPQRPPLGLYAELLSGTSFTKNKYTNLRAWLYRAIPSADHSRFRPVTSPYRLTEACDVGTPEQLRWMPPPLPTEPTTFLQGLVCYCGAGEPSMKAGLRVYVYTCNASMDAQSLCNSDGDFLIVPQEGTLTVSTEFGTLVVPPGFFAVVLRGMRFSVRVDAPSRGYVAEVFDSHFELPPRGVIGAGGLANEEDFEFPTAAYDEAAEASWTCFQKYDGRLFSYEQDHSPFDVVAWSGNYVPYRYDLAKFCTVNTVSYDHLDPSIFCVLTAPTAEAGVASCDFVVFPPRWMVAENTFRPPYFHRNCMSEFMGNLRGVYEAKTDGGFVPGGGSLHSCMASHGPAADVTEKARAAELKPTPPQQDALAFMFESYYMMRLTKRMESSLRDAGYTDMHCWRGFARHFSPP